MLRVTKAHLPRYHIAKRWCGKTKKRRVLQPRPSHDPVPRMQLVQEVPDLWLQAPGKLVILILELLGGASFASRQRWFQLLQPQLRIRP